MRVRVQYFAILRDQRGLAEEVVETTAIVSSRELYEGLQREHGFSLPASSLRVAINDEFASMDRVLEDGDTVAFIAPVAGG